MKYPVSVILFFIVFLVGCSSPEKTFLGVYEGKPRINPPYITGNYPESPFLFYIPTSGERPVVWSAEGLPEGLTLDSETGIIKGKVEKAGNYVVVLTAENKHGKAMEKLTISIGDNLLLTPPMGWNSWNTFGKNLTEALVLETAEAMIKNGMHDLGYTYINIDDFWQLAERGKDGHIQINEEKFPRGIKYVADYLHERGFKLGIYSDAADRTCGGVCGSYGFEETDAKDFAEWGVDLLKYDYCNAPQDKQVAIERYTTMGKALRSTNRSIVFSVCEWGQLEPWTWAKEAGGHYWRTTFDIRDRWYTDQYSHSDNGVLNIIDLNAPLAQYAAPGAWNDPDMLVVGISGKSQSMNANEEHAIGCTPEQYRSHMSMWAMMASPLLSGNDVRNMDSVTIATLTNPEIIAINQDMLGKQAERKVDKDGYQVWIKPLTDGSSAVACLNKTGNIIDIKLDKNVLPELNITGDIRDVWEHANIKAKAEGLDVSLSPYECKVYVLKK